MVVEDEALIALDLERRLQRAGFDVVGIADNRDEALELFRRATRQYAKRQVTWFRHQAQADLVLGEQFSESLMPSIFRFIRETG